MDTWIYATTWVNGTDLSAVQYVDQMLSKAGTEGWELVSVVPIARATYETHHKTGWTTDVSGYRSETEQLLFVFKRRVQAP